MVNARSSAGGGSVNGGFLAPGQSETDGETDNFTDDFEYDEWDYAELVEKVLVLLRPRPDVPAIRVSAGMKCFVSFVPGSVCSLSIFVFVFHSSPFFFGLRQDEADENLRAAAVSNRRRWRVRHVCWLCIV